MSSDPVLLQLPPERSNLRLARLVVSALAADLDFGTDEIDDLKVAVDELCAVLLEDAAGPLELSFRLDGDVVAVDGRCRTSGGEPTPLHPIAEELLSIVADDFSLGAAPGERSFRLRRGSRSIAP